MAPRQAVVLGGGVGGLAAAALLARHFPRVVVLERDVRPKTSNPEAAFTGWERSGVPQFRHSHAFLARVRLVLLAHLPAVLDRLRTVGARELGLDEIVPPGLQLPPRTDDEDVVLLACRRATFEWALREHALSLPNLELREGVTVSGLVGAAARGARPVVNGVRLADRTVIPATLVVDTTGRRSRAPEWLSALRAPAPHEKTQETGIFYYTRFYRLARGKIPRGTTGLVAGDLGWVKIAVFPGDNGTFSITIGAPVRDAALKGVADAERFERFVRCFPGVAPWRRAGVSEPINGAATPVLAMGQLRNRLRHFVDREGPLAPGFIALGDAAYHSNPIYGRGCASALVQVGLLDDALERHPTDLRAAAVYLHRRSEAELRGFWEAAVSGDRRMAGERRELKIRDPLPWLAETMERGFGWYVDKVVVPAIRVDPVVFRGLMRIFNMLEPPETLFRNPEIVARSLPVLARVLAGDTPPPQFPDVTRAQALAQLEGDATAR